MKGDKTKKDEKKGKDGDELDMDQLEKVSGGDGDLNTVEPEHKKITLKRR